jgi:5-methylcytosine-specific restriction endonuclease McrA
VARLAPERYKIQFTIGPETLAKLRRVQDLLRHSIPDGDPAAVFDRALSRLLTELERTKVAATSRLRTGRPTVSDSQNRRSRHIPAAVKRAVWIRDGGRCAFVGQAGRCTETGFLEFHHVVPYAAGGPAVVKNIELRCAAHNAHEAEMYFGLRDPLLTRERAPLYRTTLTRATVPKKVTV